MPALSEVTSGLLRDAWMALEGDPDLLELVTVTGNGAGLLSSTLAALPAMLAAVAASTLAASVLDGARREGASAPVVVDAEHVALAARSERFARIGTGGGRCRARRARGPQRAVRPRAGTGRGGLVRFSFAVLADSRWLVAPARQLCLASGARPVGAWMPRRPRSRRGGRAQLARRGARERSCCQRRARVRRAQLGGVAEAPAGLSGCGAPPARKRRWRWAGPARRPGQGRGGPTSARPHAGNCRPGRYPDAGGVGCRGPAVGQPAPTGDSGAGTGHAARKAQRATRLRRAIGSGTSRRAASRGRRGGTGLQARCAIPLRLVSRRADPKASAPFRGHALRLGRDRPVGGQARL